MRSLLFCLSFLLLSCVAKIKYKTDYLGVLNSLEKNAIPETSFQDEWVALSGALSPYAITLMLTNKSKDKLEIVWDETVFVDSLRTFHTLFHEAIPYDQATQKKKPQIVLPNESYNTTLTRSDNIYFVQDNYVGWTGGEIFPLTMIGRPYKGKQAGETADQRLDNYLSRNKILQNNHYLKVVLRKNKVKKTYYLSFKVSQAYLDK